VIDTLDTLKSLDTLEPLDTLAPRGSRVSTVSRINRIRRPPTGAGTLIREELDIKPLAVAVISRAIREVRGRNTLAAYCAALWLSGDDCALWLDGIGLDADGLKLLTKLKGKNAVLPVFHSLNIQEAQALRKSITPKLGELIVGDLRRRGKPDKHARKQRKERTYATQD
jgi:hypothetical protein